MWLLDKMLRLVIKTGELIVTDYDGKVYRYGTPDPSRPAVKVRLTDKDALVRTRAAYELGRSGAREAVAPLLKACSDESADVREAAARALEWLSAAPAAKDALHAAAAPLSAQLSSESANADYARVNDELKQLQIKLSRL